jgi:lysozyme
MKSLVEKIKEHEGYRSTVYQCTEGYDTIGYGFAIKDLELSKEVCDIILTEKIAKLQLDISSKFEWFEDSPEIVKDVVTNMCYQLGLTGFSKFKQRSLS